jgi:hypothetical protein
MSTELKEVKEVKEVKVKVEEVAAGTASKQLNYTIGDILAQTALFQVIQKAWYRRHGTL